MKKIKLFEALLPVVALVCLLAYNVLWVYDGENDDVLAGSNQFILLIGGVIASVIGFFRLKIPFDTMTKQIYENIKSTSGSIYILLLVGSLSGAWLISGIIPSMIFYGLKILNPTLFLVSCVVICAIISLVTGSSWTTAATIGIALMGIGDALQIPMGMTGGAIISGAYFGDKLSPMSDTTNLAAAMAEVNLFTHIRYMSFTTIPTFIITLLIFLVLGFTATSDAVPDTSYIEQIIWQKFNTSLWLFIVPILILIMVLKKVNPVIALLSGTLLGGIFAIIFQPQLILELTGSQELNIKTAYRAVMDAVTLPTKIPMDDPALSDLFSSKGMGGMLGTIWLIICAMFFGGIMESIGALQCITEALLKLFKSTIGLFASTLASSLAMNITASDQYLSIVVPGKMFAKAYQKKGLAPENLSRTLEDGGTVTSVLIPWNTCAAYNSGVLGIPTLTYLPYAFFNLISPFMTLLFVMLGRIRRKTD